MREDPSGFKFEVNWQRAIHRETYTERGNMVNEVERQLRIYDDCYGTGNFFVSIVRELYDLFILSPLESLKLRDKNGKLCREFERKSES